MTGLLPALVLFGLSGATTVAPARLDYAPPAKVEACPSRADLEDAGSARLGYVIWRSHAQREVEVRLRPRGRRVGATVRILDAGQAAGERQLTAATCPALAASVALAISIAIDPLSTGRPPPPDRPEPEPEAPPPAPEPPTPEPEPEPDPPVQIFGALGVHVGLRTAPGPALGARLQVGARRGSLSLALEGRADLPASLDVGEGARVRSARLSVGVSPCWHFGPVAGCLLGTAGVLRADAEGLAEAETGAAFHATVGARIAAGWRVHPAITVGAHADVAAVLTRIEIVDPASGVPYWTTPPLAFSLAAVVQADFL